jgi:hypothetical protein
MEKAPDDARAAPTAAGPANTDTIESLSPKNPRESASGKKVRLGFVFGFLEHAFLSCGVNLFLGSHGEGAR